MREKRAILKQEILKFCNGYLRENIIEDNEKILQILMDINEWNQSKISYVYFLLNHDTQLTKIGSSKDIRTRILQIKSTFRNLAGIEPDLEIAGLIACKQGNEKIIEKLMHRNFDHVRKWGEWFDLTEEEYLYDIICPEIVIAGIPIGVEDGFLDSQIDIYAPLSLKDVSSLKLFSSNTLKELIKYVENPRDPFPISVGNNRNLVDVLNNLGNEEKFHTKDLADKVNIEDIISIKNTLNIRRQLC